MLVNLNALSVSSRPMKRLPENQDLAFAPYRLRAANVGH